MLGAILKFFGFRVVPTLVLLVAILVGWLATSDYPEGVLFATAMPLFAGKCPPVICGAYSEPLTPAVPDDKQPDPRPEGEVFKTLPSGAKMPQVGLGMCCRAGAYDHETVRRNVLWYFLLGGRHIDTAQLYLNHAAIGEAIKEAIRRGIPRSDMFITTKIWPRQFGYNASQKDVEVMLGDLDLEYVDLVLMHAPKMMHPYFTSECNSLGLSYSECRAATWKGLSETVKAGLVRDIGVSNFLPNHLEEIASLNLVPVAVNQFQWNPWSAEVWQNVFTYSQEHNIAVTAWGSLAGTTFQHTKAFTQETLTKIGEVHSRPVAQILLRYAIQKGAIVIPGTGNPKHMKQNLEIFSFTLSEDEINKIEALKDDPAAKEFMASPADPL